MRNRCLMVAALAAVLCSRAFGAGTLETFQAANQAYHAKNYARAAELYREVATRVPSASVLYDLGNATFKAGHVGEAVLALEKAHRLSPRDRDIRDNLSFVKSRVKDNLPEEELDFVSRLIWMVPDHFSTNELAVAVAVLLWLTMGVAGALVTNREPERAERLRVGLVAAAFTLVATGAVLGLKVYAQEAQPQGIVTSSEIQAYAGPGTDELKRFSLHEGACVRILKESSNWLQIALPNGESGWTPQAGVGKI